jgi:hypothetical protein
VAVVADRTTVVPLQRAEMDRRGSLSPSLSKWQEFERARRNGYHFILRVNTRPGEASMSTPEIVKDFLQLRTQVDLFTSLEVVGLEVWQDLRDRQEFGLAHDVLQATLAAEHWKSEISENPLQITTQQADEFQRRMQVLTDLLSQANRITAKVYKL